MRQFNLKLVGILLTTAILASSVTTDAPRIRAIYGEDSRREVGLANDMRWINAARATAALVHVDQHSSEDGSHIHFRAKKLREEDTYCEEERFLEQPTLAFCSGVLIAPRLLLTAGHCLESSNRCSEFRVVFGYDVRHSSRLSFEHSNVYSCKNIIARKVPKHWDSPDYAIIELDRDVVGREPQAMERPGRAPSMLTMIGSPLGLPAKISDGALLRIGKTGYLGSLDAFGGNSGSPVYDSRTQKIVGILSSGEEDFETDPRGCQRSVRCNAERSCSGEYVTANADILNEINLTRR